MSVVFFSFKMKRKSKSRRESRSRCLLATLCSLLCCWIFVLLLFLAVGRGPPEADSVQTESDDAISYFPPKEQATASHSPEVWTQDPNEREERIKQRMRRWLGEVDDTMPAMPETAIATSDSPGEYRARDFSQKKKRKEEWQEEKGKAKMKPSPTFSYRKGPSPRSHVAPPSPEPLRFGLITLSCAWHTLSSSQMPSFETGREQGYMAES